MIEGRRTGFAVSREDLAVRLTREQRRVGIAANLTGSLVLAVLAAGLGPTDDLPEERRLEVVAVFVGFAVLVFPVLTIVLSRAAGPWVRALREGRPLLGDARRALFASPWRNAIMSFTGWLAAAVVFSTESAIRLGNGPDEAAALGATIVLAGLTTLALVYLFNERVLRPAFALAFTQEAPDSVRGVAVRPRMLLAWALGAGIPLLVVLISLFDPEADVGDIRRLAGAFIGVALGAGWLITLRVARSVADPIELVRRAVARVGAGDLEAEVAVDDATEIGLLQAGFNDMVVGLREREQLHDLFGRHVGEEVARQALERGVELGGEVREATALFVDLVGSTALASSRPPQEVVALLNDFFEAIVDVAAAEGGWVNKFEGDAALCVFGAPARQADHAARGLRAARALRMELAGLRARYPDLDAGIGVSSGDMLAGNVGAKQRYEYTVIGDPVNEAARLTEDAKVRPGRVLASEAAVRAADDEARWWQPAGTLLLRGRSSPTAVYEPAR